jgi:anthranilate phosphoribosyltransferase
MLSLNDANDLVRLPGGMTDANVADLLSLILSGTLTPEAGGQLLATWSTRGETGAELAAVVGFLLDRAVVIPGARDCLDLCGTGGSGRARFNVSTTAAIALASAEVPVAKHGNRGSLRPDGSFDLLDRLAVPYLLKPEAHAQLLDRGLCFLFARAMHPAVAAAAPYRKAAGRRTIFNLAGPLANPCRPRVQIIGVANWAVAGVVADALLRLAGTDAAGKQGRRALVVHGHPGIDEISLSGPSRWLEVSPAGIREGGWIPAETIAEDGIPAGDAEVNAPLVRELFAGGGPPALRRLVAVNIAAALDLWHGRPVLADHGRITEAEHLLRADAAGAAFARHVAHATKLAG